ncbi:MAG: aquaporin [Thermomicrobiales bacterium]|nr:aquaporin [Thermomicrobiales bacterium]
MDNREWTKLAIVEFLGPFALCFMGIGAIIQTHLNGGSGDIVAIALAHGMGIGLLVAAAGHISGGVYNPALTIGLLVTRRIDRQRAIVYIVAQCLGGLAACGALTLVYRDVDRNRDGVNLGVPAVGANHSVWNALGMEFILTFFLMFVVFGVAIDNRTGGRAVAALAIGLTITMDVLAGGAISGAIMNPARWIGPAIIQGDFSDFWIWIVGPVAGAVVAAVIYNDVLLAGTPAGAAPSDRIDPEHPRAVVESEVRQEAAERSRRARRRGR